jgi:hypothetical protein
MEEAKLSHEEITPWRPNPPKGSKRRIATESGKRLSEALSYLPLNQDTTSWLIL